jgi:hypothetical protein
MLATVSPRACTKRSTTTVGERRPRSSPSRRRARADPGHPFRHRSGVGHRDQRSLRLLPDARPEGWDWEIGRPVGLEPVPSDFKRVRYLCGSRDYDGASRPGTPHGQARALSLRHLRACGLALPEPAIPPRASRFYDNPAPSPIAARDQRAHAAVRASHGEARRQGNDSSRYIATPPACSASAAVGLVPPAAAPRHGVRAAGLTSRIRRPAPSRTTSPSQASSTASLPAPLNSTSSPQHQCTSWTTRPAAPACTARTLRLTGRTPGRGSRGWQPEFTWFGGRWPGLRRRSARHCSAIPRGEMQACSTSSTICHGAFPLLLPFTGTPLPAQRSRAQFERAIVPKFIGSC